MTFIEAPIKSLNELQKIRDSNIVISVFDLERNMLYGKGQYKLSKILNETEQFKLNI
jgi:hypothetical protein